MVGFIAGFVCPIGPLVGGWLETSGIPEGAGDWRQAKRGMFYRPVKQQITLRLDADLIDWFKTHPVLDEGYQTTINRALREYVSQRSVAGQAEGGDR
jgi:BrnA antitoxin of type II toxin-antitoxin system